MALQIGRKHVAGIKTQYNLIKHNLCLAALHRTVKVKVNQCRYRPAVAQRVPESSGSQTT